MAETTGANLDAFDSESLVGNYIRCRERKAEISRQFDEQLKPIIEAMGVIEHELHARMVKAGETSKKTKAGTAFIKSADTVSVTDWGLAFPFIQANNLWGFIEAKANKTAAKEYMKEHDGQLPPGLSYRAVQVCQIRSPKD